MKIKAIIVIVIGALMLLFNEIYIAKGGRIKALKCQSKEDLYVCVNKEARTECLPFAIEENIFPNCNDCLVGCNEYDAREHIMAYEYQEIYNKFPGVCKKAIEKCMYTTSSYPIILITGIIFLIGGGILFLRKESKSIFLRP